MHTSPVDPVPPMAPPSRAPSGGGESAPAASFAALLGGALDDARAPVGTAGAAKPKKESSQTADATDPSALLAALNALVPRLGQVAPDQARALQALLGKLAAPSGAVGPSGEPSGAVQPGATPGPGNAPSTVPADPRLGKDGTATDDPDPAAGSSDGPANGDASRQVFAAIARLLDELERAETAGSHSTGAVAPSARADAAKPASVEISPALLDRLRTATLAAAVGGVTVSVDSPKPSAADAIAIAGRPAAPGPSPEPAAKGATRPPTEGAGSAQLVVADAGGAGSTGKRSHDRAGSDPRPPGPRLASDPTAPAGIVGSPSVRNVAASAGPGAPAEAGAARALPEQIAAQTKLALDQGRSEVRLQLQPESLGRLDVRLSFDGGAVTVHLNAESADVGNLLQANLGHLQSAFEHQGIRTDQLLVFVAPGLTAGDPRDRSLDGRTQGRDARSRSSRRIDGIAGLDEDGTRPSDASWPGSGDALVDARV